jgi:hypothetical protein
MGEQQVEDAASIQLEENIDSKMEDNSSVRRIDMTGSVRDATEREDDHENTDSEMFGYVDESSEFMIITPQEIHDQRLKLKVKRDRTIPLLGSSETSSFSESCVPGAFAVEGGNDAKEQNQSSEEKEDMHQDFSPSQGKVAQYQEIEAYSEDDMESVELIISPQEIHDQRVKLMRKKEREEEMHGAGTDAQPGVFLNPQENRAKDIGVSSGSDDENEIFSSELLDVPKTNLNREPEFHMDVPGAFGMSRKTRVYGSGEDEKSVPDIEQPGIEDDGALRLEAEAVDEDNQIERIRQQQEEIERLRGEVERVVLNFTQQANKKPKDVAVALATKVSAVETSKLVSKKKKEPDIEIPSNSRQIICCILIIVGIITGAVVGIVVSQSGGESDDASSANP